eukprot:m.36519 g.36519  ORF g.36519 m.36519 type:complete len:56 (+) comp32261_c0_seq1:75-242(+)
MRLLNQLMQRFICCCSRQTKVQPERNSAKSQTMSTQWNYSELGAKSQQNSCVILK